MVFSQQQKIFMVEAYLRNGRKVEGVWEYSISACIEEFRIEFPEMVFEYEMFRQTLNLYICNFRQTGSITRKSGSRRPKKRTPEVIENVRQIMELATEKWEHGLLLAAVELVDHTYSMVTFFNFYYLLVNALTIFLGNINAVRYREGILTPFFNELHDD
ncbi:hypothetical protein BDFB_011406, partial [Asbolus verrucosus]